MKKTIGLILTFLLALTIVPVSSFSSDGVAVMLDDRAVLFADSQPYIDGNGRTLAPISPIAQAMNMTYAWDHSMKTAVFTKDYTLENTPLFEGANETHSENYYLGRETVTLTIGSRDLVYSAYFYSAADQDKVAPIQDRIYQNTIPMDTAAVLKGGRTYAPVAYLAQTLGYAVLWQEQTRTAYIYTNKNDNALLALDLLGVGSNHLSFGVFKGRLFDVAGISQIRFQSARIGTQAGTSLAFTDDEIAQIKTNFGHDYLAGSRIRGNFSSNRANEVNLFFTIVYATGLTASYQYSFDYTYSGTDGGM